MRLSKGWTTIIVVILLLVTAEATLQIRAHYRYGNSMFTKVLQYFGYADTKKLFQYNDDLGFFTLTPNIIHSSKKITTKTNNLGIRSPEITAAKEEGEFRYLVIGASTIQGASAETNEDLFSYKLNKLLSEKYKNTKISFLNAGIAGLKLEQQIVFYERVLKHYKPDLVVVYTGVNDFEKFCATNSGDSEENYGLPGLSLPKWVLSYELITKNTTWSKPDHAASSSLIVSGDMIKADEYRSGLSNLVGSIRETGAIVYLLSNAKSYRVSMPLDQQKSLSRLSTYYYPCLDLDLLYTAYSKFNQSIKAVAAEIPGARFVDTESIIPGGSRYFSDPVHFSEVGETLLSESIASMIFEDNLVLNKNR